MLIVLDASSDFASEVAELLPDHPVVHVPDPARLGAATAGRPAVVVIGPGADLTEALAAVEADEPRHGLVVVVSRLLTRTMRAAMHAGAVDVLTDKSSPNELREAVRRAEASLDPAPTPAATAAQPAPPTAGRILTVFSTKGGSGTSVVATNLAIDLASKGLRTCIVDLDLQFGDVAIMMQLRPTTTIHEVATAPASFVEAELESAIVRHDSGVAVLCAPEDPAHADDVGADAVTRILGELSRQYDRIVVDTPAAFTDALLAAIDMSDRVILVATLDVPSIKDLRLGISTLRRLGVEPTSLSLVMNRANSRVGLRGGEVERSFGIPVDVDLPSDRDVVVSLNHGVPMMIGHPRSAVSAGIRKLAAKLEGEPTTPMTQVVRRAGNALRRRAAPEPAPTTSTQ